MDYIESFFYGLRLGATVMIWFLILAIVAFPNTVGAWKAEVDNAYDKVRVYNTEVE